MGIRNVITKNKKEMFYMLYNQKTQKNIDQLLIELLDPDKTSESKIKEQLKTMNIEEFLTKIENLNFSQKIIQRSKAL